MDPADKAALIEHLTAEIEVATETLIAQRTRNNFTIAIGPFLLLGAYVLGDKPSPQLSKIPGWALGAAGTIFIAFYMVLGMLAARVERRLWDQCNNWRAQIAVLCGLDRDAIQFAHRGLVPSYVAIYGSLALVFCVLVAVMESIT